MARDFSGTPQSPVIIMSTDDYTAGQGAAWEAGRYVKHHATAADGGGTDQSSCLPRLVVPGFTPHSSVSSQSCLSVPGVPDLNGYTTSLHRVSKNIPNVFDCNLKTNKRILIIFGTNISDKTCHQMTV